MKKTLLVILSPVALLALLLLFMPQHFAKSSSTASAPIHTRSVEPQQINFTSTDAEVAEVTEGPTVFETYNIRKNTYADEAQGLVEYALTLMGTPYVWAGETPDGFDCSGFITHVYDKYAVQLPHSSRMQAEEGENVSRQEARPGDLVIFTGTNSQVREPGHVGIVISQPGDTIEFVHSSSNGGVKISQVEGSGYEKRFLQVRRVL